MADLVHEDGEEVERERARLGALQQPALRRVEEDALLVGIGELAARSVELARVVVGVVGPIDRSCAAAAFGLFAGTRLNLRPLAAGPAHARKPAAISFSTCSRSR